MTSTRIRLARLLRRAASRIDNSPRTVRVFIDGADIETYVRAMRRSQPGSTDA